MLIPSRELTCKATIEAKVTRVRVTDGTWIKTPPDEEVTFTCTAMAGHVLGHTFITTQPKEKTE